jgi:hypothetical protein
LVRCDPLSADPIACLAPGNKEAPAPTWRQGLDS